MMRRNGEKRKELNYDNEEKITKRYKIGAMGLTVLFSVLMFNFLIDNFAYNQTQIVSYRMEIVAFTLILFVFFMQFFIGKEINREECALSSGKRKWLIAVVVLILQIIIIAVSFRGIGWDCGTVISLADELERLNTVSWSYYLAEYPNNALLVCFWHDIFRITNGIGIDKWVVALGINVFCIDSAVYLVCLVCRKIWNERVELCSLIFGTIMLGFSFWIIVPYTDTLSMPIPLFLFYLYLKIKERGEKIGHTVLFGVVCFVGYMLKPTNIIIVIAICLIKVLQIKFQPHGVIKNGILVGTVIITICIASALFDTHKDTLYEGVVTKEDEYNYSVDMLHYIKMGLREPYGSFNMEDVNKMGIIIGQDNKRNYNLQEIKRRFKEHGIVGYIKFLYKKASYVYTDGTFFFGGEGDFYTTDNGIKLKGAFKWIRDLRTYGTDSYNIWSCNIAEAIWICILSYMFVGASFDIKKEKKDENLLVLRTSILGITAFLLLFESRSRYLLNHLPVMIMLASYGCIQMSDYVKEFFRKRDLKKFV